MDRNSVGLSYFYIIKVALRKESVDRNTTRMRIIKKHHVALRKESVDRNLNVPLLGVMLLGSLSARRAWIEIQPGCA